MWEMNLKMIENVVNQCGGDAISFPTFPPFISGIRHIHFPH
jgi:hypothetical protein